MITNVMLLAAWTVESLPVSTHVPVENNSDVFGRTVKSYGICSGRLDEEDGSNLSILFMLLCLAIINLGVISIAFYQLYLTRKLPSQFNEAEHVIWCMEIMEAVIIGVPILFVVKSNPTAYFLM